MKRRRLLASLGGLSVAGCLRLESGEGTTVDGTTRATATTVAASTTAETATATEEATTEATTEREEPAYPTGLHADGVYAYLADTHLNHLSKTSFEERWRRRNRTDDWVGGANVRVADGAALVTSPEHDAESYHTADGVYWRAPGGSGTLYGNADGTFDFQNVARVSELRALLLGASWAAPEESDVGWRVDITGVDEPTALENRFGFSRLESISGNAEVTPDGVIKSLRAVVEAVDGDRGRTVEYAFGHRVLAVGTAAVSEPSWYATAVDEAPTVSVSLTDDGRFVVLEHRSGSPIAAEDTFHLHQVDVDRAEHGRLSNPFEAGSTVYAWVPQDGGELGLRQGSRPSNVSPRALEGTLRVFVDHEGYEYFGFERVTG